MANNLNFLQNTREDDFVEYFIFPAMSSQDNETEINLKNYLQQINNVVAKYAKNYIWHKDNFKLCLRTSNTNILVEDVDNSLPPHLYGISHYGDNIEDEWFIVFLLYQITREINGVVARVDDSDGEFLLIEAANYLPKWANPEVCEKRMYIYQGNLHLVKPTNSENLEDDEEEEHDDIVLQEVINEIRKSPKNSLASEDIQNSILKKIKQYPDHINKNLHSTSVYLPVGVAAILKHKPGLIAPAVQAICNRDCIDVKACRAMKYFPPENRVYTRVTFTKFLYAMLTHSKYLPDRRTGWNLPTSDSPQYKAQILGVKIACGFEILASQAKPNEDVENDKGWISYLNSLKDKEYFNGLMEHSQPYNNLLIKAKEYYSNYRDTMYHTPIIGQEILALSKNLDYKVEQLRKLENDLPKDDEDSWLNIDSEELDRMLEEQYGQKKSMPLNSNTDAPSFTQKINRFLNHISTLEGAEFPSNGDFHEDAPPVRPPRTKKTNKTEAENNSNPYKVNFDSNQFMCALESFFDMVPEDDSWDLESDSDMSAYGDEEEIDLKECKKVKNEMEKYIQEMDRELSQTNIGKSFLRGNKSQNDAFDDVEDFEPVNMDMNALKNVLESYQAQLGEAGPASTLLGPMGIHLEPGTSFGQQPQNEDLQRN